MANGPSMRQELRQSQSLVMTQQLQQSIKLLQLSAGELQEFIDEELEKNPLLQREDAEGAPVESQEPSEDAPLTASERDAAERKEIDVSGEDFSVNESLYDEDFAGDWNDEAQTDFGRHSAETHSQGSGRHFDPDAEGSNLETTLTSERTLRDHLLEQIAVDFTDPAERLLAARLVDLLDDSGYLREDISRLVSELEVPAPDLEAVIEKLQRLDPPGVFARSLTECLRIQLRELNRLDPVMDTMLTNIELMAKGDVVGLRKICGVDEEDFTQMLADLRRCNPKPASGFLHDEASLVIPDVLVRRMRGGGWLVELNSEALPRVLINRQYAGEVNRRAVKDAKKYLSEQLANANWLIKALDQRAQTILKVAQEIVKQQEMFLLHGIRFLKPLVLKDIAAAIGMHESTISRVTTSKFMATPRGTLELKYFFTSAIQSGSAGGEDFSSKTVMYYIKELVDGEDPKKILSDDKIVKKLKDRNIDVARRTVTKYREALNIPSSVVRRRQKHHE
ncbi:MAG: RNA polymerase factor sigma-54 [Alphaproteobacteria bacterium]|jgi:RNA polymerase sigma-54 factor